MLFITRGNLNKLLGSLSGDYRVFIPTRRGERAAFSRFSEDTLEKMVLGGVRGFEPLKAFYFLGREKVAEGFSPVLPHGSDTPPCIVGVKACDLKGFRILDHVFMDDEYGDPTYIKARNEGLIISSDCTDAIDTCFCCAVGGKPWPESNFDINLSPSQDGFLVLTGSEKGSIGIAHRRADAGAEHGIDQQIVLGAEPAHFPSPILPGGSDDLDLFGQTVQIGACVRSQVLVGGQHHDCDFVAQLV